MAGRFKGTPYEKPPLIIRPERANYLKPHLLGMSSETRKIFEELERMNTPVKDARKMPLNLPSVVRTDCPETSTSKPVGPPKLGLLTPTRAQILPRLSVVSRSRLENGGSAAADSWNSFKSAKSPEKSHEQSDGGGKIRVLSGSRSTFSARRDELDETTDGCGTEFLDSTLFTFSKPRVVSTSTGLVKSTTKTAEYKPANDKRKLSPDAQQPTAKRLEPTKPAVKHWYCSVCYASNSEDSSACCCCTTPKAGASKALTAKEPLKLVSAAPTPSQPQFAFGFGGSLTSTTSLPATERNTNALGGSTGVQCGFEEYKRAAKWRCSFCFFNNHKDEATCVQCQKKKEDSAKNEIEKLKPPADEPSNSVDSMTKPTVAVNSAKADSNGPKWSCSCCFIPNSADSTSCAACGSAKPVPPSVKKWTCSDCFVTNEPQANSCVCCSASKPGSDAKKAEAKAPAFGGSLFKPTEPSKSEGFSFGFGTPLSTPGASAKTAQATPPTTLSLPPAVGSGKKSVRFAEPLSTSTAADAITSPTSPMQMTPMSEPQPLISSTTDVQSSLVTEKIQEEKTTILPSFTFGATSTPAASLPPPTTSQFNLPVLPGGLFGATQKDSGLFQFGPGGNGKPTEAVKVGADSTTETTSAAATRSTVVPVITFGSTAAGITPSSSTSSLSAASAAPSKVVPTFGITTSAPGPAFPSIPPSFTFGTSAAQTAQTPAVTTTAPPSFLFGSRASSTTTTAPAFSSFAPVSTGSALPSFGSFTSSTTSADSTVKPSGQFGSSSSLTSFMPSSTGPGSLFGSSANSTTSGSTSTTFNFGSGSATKPLFGQSSAAPTSLAAAPTFNFGPVSTTESKGTGGGLISSGMKLFGAAAQTSTTTPSFSGFGSTAPSMTTSTPNNSATNLFGSAMSSVPPLPSSGSATNLFGGPSTLPSMGSTGSLFGSFPQTQPVSAGSGVFQFGGNSNTTATPSFSFGPPASGPAAGLNTAVPNAFAFGSAPPQQAPSVPQFNLQSSGFNFGTAAAPTAVPDVFQFGGAPQQPGGNMFSVQQSSSTLTPSNAATRRLLQAKRKATGKK